MIKHIFPWKFIIKRTARAYGFIDPISLMAYLRRFAQSSEVQEPIELIRAGILFHARGLINTKAIQNNLDWIWPYWVQRQFNPGDVSFMPRSFSVSHVNLTQRNWTAVGHPEFALYPIIDPRGLVTPLYDGWSLDFWIVAPHGDALYPSKLRQVRQKLAHRPYPVVETLAEEGLKSLKSRVWFDVEAGKPVLHIDLSAKSAQGGYMVVTLRPYNPEGIQFIEKITCQNDPPRFRVNDDQIVNFSRRPQRVCFSDYSEGDVVHRLGEQNMSSRITCKVGMATAAALFPLPENDRESELQLSLPLVQKGQSAAAATSESASTAWSSALGFAPTLNIPDQWISQVFENAVSTLILLSADEAVPGPYTYKRFWFRDACLMIHALLVLGFADRCQRLLSAFPARQKRNGYFHSQEGEWDANGQVLWILNRFQQLTGNLDISRWQPVLIRAAQWIRKKRLAAGSGQPYAGLLPPGFSAEHLGPIDYYYWDNFWSLAGLRAAAGLLKDHEKTSRQFLSRIEAAAGEMEEFLFKSIDAIPSRHSRGAIPASPFRRMDAGAIGSLVADYPLQLTAPGYEKINKTVEFLLENCFHKGGFFQDMIHSGINPYLTLCLAQTLLRNGDQRYRKLLQTVAHLASATGQWPEAIHPLTAGGCMGDGQHGWAAAEWIMMIRNLFIREEGDMLVLGSGIFPEWLAEGQTISFGPTLTPHGPLSVSFQPAPEGLRLNVDGANLAEDAFLEARVPGYAPTTMTADTPDITLSREST